MTYLQAPQGQSQLVPEQDSPQVQVSLHESFAQWSVVSTELFIAAVSALQQSPVASAVATQAASPQAQPSPAQVSPHAHCISQHFSEEAKAFVLQQLDWLD